MESEIESFKKFVTCNIENLIKILHNNLRYITILHYMKRLYSYKILLTILVELFKQLKLMKSRISHIIN